MAHAGGTGSSDELIDEECEYCPSCGEKLPDGVFGQRHISPLGEFCETAIERMGINPVLARAGYEAWVFHKGSSQIRMFVADEDYLFVVSPVNLLPKKNVEPVLEYMLDAGNGLTPYKLGVDGRQIYMCYRLHLSDINDSSRERIAADIAGFAEKADEMDNMLAERFGCEFSVYTKQENI